MGFLRTWDFDAGTQVSVEGWMAENKADAEEAAVWFLKNDEAAAKMVKETLAKES